jgi:hypothetical protein
VYGEPLVTLPHADGVAAVMRDASGRAWLVDNVAGGAGTALEGYDAAVAGLAAVTLAGGLLAPGAVQALVTDRAGREHVAACGERAWLVLLAEPVPGDPPPVRFLDEPASWSPRRCPTTSVSRCPTGASRARCAAP